MRTRLYTAVTVVGVLALSACGVPSSGPSTRLDKVEQDSAGGSSVDPKPLKPSTSDTTTVKNFLGAAAGESNGRNKRLDVFIDGQPKQQWSEPSAGIQLIRVPDDGYQRSEDGDSRRSTVKVAGTIVGVYGPNGRVKQWSGDDEYKQSFDLVRDRSIDVWHIVDPPKQVYLSDDFFEQNYEMWPLYFPAVGSQENTLVPDPRWIPKTIVDSDARFTQLADWLLEGPSDWLASTVSNAFPEGTSRDTVTVSKDGRRVMVDISVNSASQPAKDRQAMGAQLAWTMGMSGSQTLRLLVDGQERLEENASAWSDRQRTPEEDIDSEELAYFIAEGAVMSSEENAAYEGTEVPGLSQAVINREGDRLAAVAGERLYVGPAGDLEPVGGFSSGALSDPLWLDGDSLLVIDDGQPVTVNVDSGKSHEVSMDEDHDVVTELALAPDARRLAYVSEGKTWVSTILPSEGESRKLGDPVAVGEEVSDVSDVGWSRETHLLMIGSIPDEKSWLWEASIDGAYLQVPNDATVDTSRADALAVRCKPATEHSSLTGGPILLEINGVINRLYTEISAVNVGGEDAVGFAPFTAP